MDDKWETHNDEWVQALVKGTGCWATFRTEGRTPDGFGWSRKRRQIMFHP
jgi:hypothetical protein